MADTLGARQLHKIYANEGRGKYSPPECIGCKPKAITGDPDPMRRFTCLTNAFSEKFENHAHMIALYTVWYNWVRIHKTLRVTPAMAAGLTDRMWDFAKIVKLMDEVNSPAKG